MLSERLLQFSLLGAEWVLWLLLGLSVLSVAVMVERYLLFRRTRVDLNPLEQALRRSSLDTDLQSARNAVAGDSFVGNVLRAGLDALDAGVTHRGRVEQAMLGAMAVERARADMRLTILGTIGNNAPFVGLFGTVLGVIQAFQHLDAAAAEAAGNPHVMAALGEALVATAVGIAVAIPAVAAYNAARAAIAARSKQTEGLMQSLLAGLAGEAD